jgi:hypothetical protein
VIVGGNVRSQLRGGVSGGIGVGVAPSQHDGLVANLLTGVFYTRPAGGAVTTFASFKDMLSTFTCPATWVRGANGIWSQTAANSVPLQYNADGTIYGMIAEFASRTNSLLHSNDLTNVVWTKTNGAAAKDQIGPDGVANSASRFTASFGANATCLQPVISGSATRAFAPFLKRITGTGPISLTVDNGATWTVVPVTSSWASYNMTQAAVTNPICGLKVDTLNDAVAVTWNCLETGVTACGSPIETTTLAVTKSASSMIRTLGSEWGEPEGAIYAESVRLQGTPANQDIVRFDDNSNTNSITLRNAATSPRFLSSRSGSVDLGNGLDTTANGSVQKFAARYKDADYARVSNNGTVRTSAATGTVTPVLTRMRLGTSFFAGSEFCGFIRRIEYWPRALTNAELQALVA